MISAAQILIVLLVGVSVVMLLYWRRRRHSSDGALDAQTDACRTEADMPVVAMGDTVTVTSQEIAEEQLREPDGTDQGVGELESRTESAGDQRHPLDESAKKKGARRGAPAGRCWDTNQCG